MGQVLRATGTEDQASVERSGLSPNPSPPAHRRTVTRNQISYQLRKEMRKKTLMWVSLAAVIAMGSLGMNASAQPKRFVQDRFAIGFWVGPPADENMDRHYADIAAANFTMVIGGFGARTPATRRTRPCAPASSPTISPA